MAQNKFNEIFKRLYTGLQSKRDEKELLESGVINSMMEEQWDHPEEMKDQVKAPEFDAIFSRIEAKAYHKPKLRRFPVYRLVAGFALLAGLTAALYFMFQKSKAVEQLNFATTSGEVKSFLLPDGTTLWLGENSRASFPAKIESGRVVDLEGLAFFKVVKNNTPFTVNTGLLSVEVTGTEFSVSAYKNATDIETTLVEGSVNVTDGKGVLLKKLKPNEKFNFNKITGSFRVKNVNARELTLWKESKLIFNNNSLPDIAAELSKRYGVNVRVEKNAAAYKFTFTLGTESLDETLSLIGSLAPVNARQSNDTIVFSVSK